MSRGLIYRSDLRGETTVGIVPTWFSYINGHYPNVWEHLGGVWEDSRHSNSTVYCTHCFILTPEEMQELRDAVTEILNHLEMARNPPRDL